MMQLLLALLWPALALSAPYRETHYVKECRPLDSVGESCVWNVVADASKCPDGKCSKLVLFFNGADMNCDRLKGFQKKRLGHLMDRYSRNGYVAVTACLYETLKGANALTMGEQIGRVGTLYESVTTDPEVQRHWNGEHILVAGVSIGASTPVVALIRSRFGLKEPGKVAACFHDGVYDIYAMDKFLWENRSSCNTSRNQSICKRYADKKRCDYPLTQTTETEFDSVGLTPLQGLPVDDWKLIECGSRHPGGKCALRGGDWVPAAPIEAFCRRIAAEPDHRCEFASQPLDSHLACAFGDQGIDNCRLWFDAKVEAFRVTAAKN